MLWVCHQRYGSKINIYWSEKKYNGLFLHWCRKILSCKIMQTLVWGNPSILHNPHTKCAVVPTDLKTHQKERSWFPAIKINSLGKKSLSVMDFSCLDSGKAKDYERLFQVLFLQERVSIHGAAGTDFGSQSHLVANQQPFTNDVRSKFRSFLNVHSNILMLETFENWAIR